MSDNSKHVVVIGAGPGGYAAAFMAADLGLNVTLVDRRENPGGVCLYEGCIPSKALLHAAEVIKHAREANEFGLTFGEPEINLDRLRSWKEKVVKQLTDGLGTLGKQRKVQYVRGTARFANNEKLLIETDQGSREESFDFAIIATGSLPTRVPGFPESNLIMDSTGALELEAVPDRLLVVGGGYIGLEMSTVYASLGSKVTVVEMADQILPGTDQDLVRPLRKSLDSLLDSIYTSTKVEALSEENGLIRAELAGDNISESTKTFDKVLVSIGRKPVLDDLGLENTAVRVESGFIQVDSTCRTSERTIYAIGDVVGQPMLAHKASHEGRVAAEAIAGHKVAFEPYAIPAVVFTDPEIAYCGLTEAQAKERGKSVKVARFPWAASGRAMTLGGDTSGVTKLIIDPDTERVLGVGIVGRGAGELIAEGVLAIEMGALARDIALSIHPHPTLSESIMESAEVFFGQATHIYKKAT